MLFWFEEEGEAEFESKKSRIRRERVEYDAEQGDATLEEATAPMSINMDEARNMSMTGLVWFHFLNPTRTGENHKGKMLEQNPTDVYFALWGLLDSHVSCIYPCDITIIHHGPWNEPMFHTIVLRNWWGQPSNACQVLLGAATSQQVVHLHVVSHLCCPRSKRMRNRHSSFWSTWKASTNVCWNSPSLDWSHYQKMHWTWTTCVCFLAPQELKNKYEEIDVADRSTAQSAYLALFNCANVYTT